MVSSRAAPPSALPSAASTSQSTLNTAYSLALLSEYTHTLDSLPLDLSRSFADLRELDAVLSSSMITITAKIHHLTSMIEERKGTKEERLWLLHEIAEEAARLKFGGDDKIRVACQAADTLKAHSAHLRTLADRLPDFDAALLNRRTIYPHVSAKSFMPLNMDTGRRRRGGAGSSGLLVASAVDPSPAKRKRVPREDEIDVGSVRSPHKKERMLEPSNPRSRINGRAKKNERVPSPSESLVSVTSHLPSQNTHHTNGTSTSARGASSSHQQNHTSALSASTNNRTANGANTKRRGGNNASANGNNNNSRVSTTPLPSDYPSHNPPASISSHRAGSGGAGIPSSTSNHHHSSSSTLVGSYSNGTAIANGTGGGPGHIYDLPHSISGTPDWNPPPSQQLEGPGMPVARSTSIHSTITNGASGSGGGGGGGGRNGSVNANSTAVNSVGTDGGTTEAGDGDGDNDDGRTYCYCDSVSYGEMIACDDESCEREWFHLSCIGLTVCPEGSWFCDTCKNKRNAKRTGRGGKRRAAGSRAGGKA